MTKQTKRDAGSFKVMGKDVPYVGRNVTPEIIERIQNVMEDLAMGKTTVEKMAAEFAAQEKRKVQ